MRISFKTCKTVTDFSTKPRGNDCMQRLIRVLVIVLFILWSLSTSAVANTLYFSKLTNPEQPATESPVKGKAHYIKFGVRIPNRPVNQRYSLTFTMESAEKGSVLIKGKVVVGTKTKAGIRIILDIPGRIEDKKGEIILINFTKKDRGTEGMSTFQTIGRGDLPVKAKLTIKDLSSKVLDAVQFEALGEWKENSKDSKNPQTSVEKQSGIGKSHFYTEPALLEFAVSTGRFYSSVITILNEQDQPLHIRGYLHYILVKSSLNSFSPRESKGYSPDSVIIEPSELYLQPGEKREVNVICQVLQGEEERYYARVVLELDFPDKEDTGLNIKQGKIEELSAVSQKFKEMSSNSNKPLKFMITVKDYQAMVEKITLKRQVDFVFPDGIRDIKGTYNKRMPPGKYIAEVSFKQGDRMSISQSHIFCVK